MITRDDVRLGGGCEIRMRLSTTTVSHNTLMFVTYDDTGGSVSSKHEHTKKQQQHYTAHPPSYCIS